MGQETEVQEKKKDPREMQASPYKKKAEEIGRNWHKDERLDFMLEHLNLAELIEYWIIYRVLGLMHNE